MTVLEELQRGYQLHDRVVRPSQVIVSSGSPPETAPETVAESDESRLSPGGTD